MIGSPQPQLNEESYSAESTQGGLAHREGIRQEHRRGEAGAARSATDLCSALSGIGRRVGTEPICFGARFGTNDRTLPWLEAANSITGQ